MNIKFTNIDEEHLKDYLIVTYYIKEITPAKLELVLNKYKRVKSKSEKDEVQKILIESHLKMSLSIASRYRGAGLSFTGLIKAGNRGLIKAVKKWPENDNENFTQFLTWKIEGAIIDELIRSRNKVANKKG